MDASSEATGNDNNNDDFEYVIKRDGTKQAFDQQHVQQRIKSLCLDIHPPLTNVKWEKIVTMTLRGAHNGIKTEELDELAMDNAASLSIRDPQYGILACRICISNLHKMTPDTFSECIEKQYAHLHPSLKSPCPMINKWAYDLIMKHREFFDQMIVSDRDYNNDYFSYKTLEKSYLKRINGVVCDRPAYLWARVAIAIHGENLELVKESYDLLSQGYFIHATPTLFNACTPHQSLISCFLTVNEDDSILGLFRTYLKCAFMSKGAGGIGLSYHGVRGTNSYIAGTHGHSKGPLPFLRILNDTARAVDQGGGKRAGAFAVYLEPWHVNIYEFLEMKTVSTETVDENTKCRDLFPAMWIPDLFFERVEADAEWSLFCPHEAPGLNLVWGEEFVKLYTRYEEEGRARKKVRAYSLFKKMVETMMESGLYMLAKDTINRFSNHQHLGTIQNSNLCCEIMQYSDPHEISVCCLASIALPKFVRHSEDGKTWYDLQELYRVTRIVTRNLDSVLTINNYPPSGDGEITFDVPDHLWETSDPNVLKQFLRDVQRDPHGTAVRPVNESRKSAERTRSIGIGVQGESDTFMIMGMAFDSPEAKQLNIDIFETIYYAALSESVQLAKERGPCPAYEGSQYQKGIYQFHHYGVTPSSRWDWKELDKNRQKHGMRNSLLVAPMPTKSTSHILQNTEAFEPPHSMIFKARVLSGEFFVVSKHVVDALRKRGLWNKKMRDKILAERGSVQKVEGFPEDLKPIFKTVYEIKMKTVIDMAADRQAFIDQSQSMNLWLPFPDIELTENMIMYAWKKKLKTLDYYLHVRAASTPLNYSLNAASQGTGIEAEVVHRDQQQEINYCLGNISSENATKHLLQGVDNIALETSCDGGRYEVTSTLDEHTVLPSVLSPRVACSLVDDETTQDYPEKSDESDKIAGTNESLPLDRTSHKRKLPSNQQGATMSSVHNETNQDNDQDPEEFMMCPFEAVDPRKRTCRQCGS